MWAGSQKSTLMVSKHSVVQQVFLDCTLRESSNLIYLMICSTSRLGDPHEDRAGFFALRFGCHNDYGRCRDLKSYRKRLVLVGGNREPLLYSDGIRPRKGPFTGRAIASPRSDR